MNSVNENHLYTVVIKHLWRRSPCPDQTFTKSYIHTYIIHKYFILQELFVWTLRGFNHCCQLLQFSRKKHSFLNLILLLSGRTLSCPVSPWPSEYSIISAKYTSHVIKNVCKWYFNYWKLDRVKNRCSKFFICTLYVMDILLLQKTGRGENFITLNFSYVQKGYFWF